MKEYGPPRPTAIATLLLTNDFLPGAQTLLYSIEEKCDGAAPSKDSAAASASATDEYAAERIVLVTPNISQEVRNALHPAFCTRIIQVDPIAIPGQDNANSTHVPSWDGSVGYTKLHIFNLDVYDQILYIDSDCLVKRDLRHLFRIDSKDRKGLLAAASDIFPPDKFNAGVLLIRPSSEIFDDIMSKTKELTTYDGGDTGFLNAYYTNWYTEMPPQSRLGFGYNAQRFMYNCTYTKQPKYWEVGIGSDLAIVHYSSSPKPWQSQSREKDEIASSASQNQSDWLSEEDKGRIAQSAKIDSALDKLWNKAYRKSIIHAENFKEKQVLMQKAKAAPSRPAAKPIPTKKTFGEKLSSAKRHRRRYNELRKGGMDSQAAMKAVRLEFSIDKEDALSDGDKVAQMLGVPL